MNPSIKPMSNVWSAHQTEKMLLPQLFNLSNENAVHFNTSPSTYLVSAIITSVSSTLSIIGGVILISSFYVLPETRNPVRRMLVALTIADICTAVGYEMGSVFWFISKKSLSNDALCKTQSFMTTFSSMVSFIWTTFIAVYLFVCVTKKIGNFLTARRMLVLHFIAWGIPIGITVLALAFGVLGSNNGAYTGVWCWIKTSSDPRIDNIWMLVAGKGWEILMYLIITVLYLVLKITKTFKIIRSGGLIINARSWSEISSELRTEDELFCFTWIIIYCLRIWGTTRFLFDIFQLRQDTLETIFFYLQSYGDSAQAFWNFILFCVCDKTVRSQLLRSIFPRSITHKEVEIHKFGNSEFAPLLE